MQEKLRKFLNFFENILVDICAYYAIWAVYARFLPIYNTRARRYIVWIWWIFMLLRFVMVVGGRDLGNLENLGNLGKMP